MTASYWGPPFPESNEERDYRYLCELHSEPVDPDWDDYLAWWEEEVAAGRIAAPEYEGAVTHG